MADGLRWRARLPRATQSAIEVAAVERGVRRRAARRCLATFVATQLGQARGTLEPNRRLPSAGNGHDVGHVLGHRSTLASGAGTPVELVRTLVCADLAGKTFEAARLGQAVVGTSLTERIAGLAKDAQGSLDQIAGQADLAQVGIGAGKGDECVALHRVQLVGFGDGQAGLRSFDRLAVAAGLGQCLGPPDLEAGHVEPVDCGGLDSGHAKPALVQRQGQSRLSGEDAVGPSAHIARGHGGSTGGLVAAHGRATQLPGSFVMVGDRRDTLLAQRLAQPVGRPLVTQRPCGPRQRLIRQRRESGHA